MQLDLKKLFDAEEQTLPFALELDQISATWNSGVTTRFKHRSQSRVRRRTAQAS